MTNKQQAAALVYSVIGNYLHHEVGAEMPPGVYEEIDRIRDKIVDDSDIEMCDLCLEFVPKNDLTEGFCTLCASGRIRAG